MPRNNTSQNARSKEGARLKSLRESMKMSVREFAKEFNVAIGSVSQWENGIRTIPGPMLKLVELYEQKIEKKK